MTPCLPGPKMSKEVVSWANTLFIIQSTRGQKTRGFGSWASGR